MLHNKKDFLNRKINMSPPQILAISFLITILIGTALLKLPVSTTRPISWLDALFTATSATTVTGLVVLDTGTAFTIFGQIVIMVLIQIGGLGLMTFAVLIILILGKKVGLKEQMLVQEALNQTSIGGVIKLVKILFVFTFVIEAIAVLLLSIRWVPEYGFAFGIYTSVFHSISAFNNAGFSLWSDNLMGYVGDPAVNLIITFLFVTGGLGFTVLADLWISKHFHQLSLHTKLMLIGTLVINVVAMLFLFAVEYTNPATLGMLDFGEKLWAAYFQAVTTRTAGFNSLDIGSMKPGSIVLMCLLMFIGAGSASTGSGIKLTTFIVIVMAVWMFLKGQNETVVFSRTIKKQIIIRSLAIVIISLILTFIMILALTITENASFLMIVFEVFSAFGTVGLSMGLTADLTDLGKEFIIVLMFIGRIGPLTLAFSLAKTQKSNIRYPEGEVFTG